MTIRILFLCISLWYTSLLAQTCPGLSTITIEGGATQCLSNSPILKVSGAKYAEKIEWYNGSTLVGTSNISIANSIGTTVAGNVNNISGQDLNHLDKPWGVAVDPNDDSIYVSDYNNDRLMKWKNGTGNIFAGVTGQTGGSTQPAGYFSNPTGLFLSSNGSLFVSDYGHHKIQKFVAGSRTSVLVAGNKSSGGGYVNLNTPFGVFVQNDTVFVADAHGGAPIFPQNVTWGNRIMKWAPNATAGTLVAGIFGDAGGNGSKQLNYPTGVYVTTNGDIYIADFANSRIQKWKRGAIAGVTIADLSKIGTGANTAVFPTDIKVDEITNTMYITATNYVIDWPAFPYNGSDNYLLKWGAEGSTIYTQLNKSAGAGNVLKTPSSLFVTPNGSIYVVDRGNNRVQAWTKSIDTTFKPTKLGSYTAKVYNTGGCLVTSNIVVIDSNFTPSVTIAASPSTDICSGGNITFTPTPKTGTISPTYQWTKDGINILGATSSTYPYTSTVGNNIACVMTANNVCKTIATATSNSITTAIIQNAVYSVSIASSPVTNINTFCSGSTAIFTATPTNGGSNPIYQWMVNGTNVGTNSNVYTTTTLNDKDVVSCQLTRTADGCTNPPEISNNPIQVTINKPTTASISKTACGSYSWHGTNYTNSGTYTFDSLNAKGCDSLTTLNLTIIQPSNATLNKTVCSSYTWHGTTYTTSGTYTFDSLNAKGCDSLTTLHLTVNTPTTATINKNACSSYTWHGTTYTTSGTYTFDSLNAKGCDSLTTLNLTINQPTTASISKTACGSYSWHGTTYINSGTYTFDSLNAKGCDSLTTLNLTINQPTTATISKTACSSYAWHGTTYTVSGSYTFDSLNAKGCDSLTTLNLTINYPTTSTISKTTNSSYSWHGTTYTTSGTYTFDSLNAKGCDSLMTLNLTINQSTGATINQSSCSSFTWHGTTYTTSGTYTFDSLNSKGADSLTSLNLTINQPTTATINKIACGSYTWHGTTYSNSGLYTFDSLNSKGCDSLTTLNLIINQPTTATINQTGCVSYTWHGTIYTTSGIYTFDSLNSKGCDSLTTLNLTINQPTNATINKLACSSYTWHGTTYTNSGTYTFDSLNSKGCDSLTTLNLTINQPTTSRINMTACGSFTWHGTTYTNSGLYTFDSLNAKGCDSLMTLNLTINQPTTAIINKSSCGSYTWHGRIYTNSGSYTFDSLNAKGCDSLTTLNLTINHSTSSTTTASFCTGGSYNFNGTTYSTAGTYIAHLTNSVGCDSAATLILTIAQNVTPFVSITASATTICSSTSVMFNANSTNAGLSPVYQWKINNVNVGNNSNSFTSSSLNNNDVITCVLTANNQCQTVNTVNSNSIKINVSTTLLPSIVVTPSATSICEGTTVSFTAQVSNGGSNPVLHWTKNGNNVGNGTIAYSDATLVNGDVIVCNLTSNSTCVTQSNVSSNIYKAVVNSIPTLTTKNITPSCGILSVDLSTAINSNTSGLIFSYFTDATLTSVATNPVTVAGTYFIKATNSASSCSTSANVVVSTFKALPIITTKQNTTPCGVKTYDLKNSISSNISGLVVAFYSDATLTHLATNPVSVPATYYVAVTNNDGCTSSANVVVAPFQDIPVIAPIVGASTICNQENTTLSDKTSGGVWSSLNPAIATVDSKGVVTAINFGVSTINYTVTNQCGQQTVPWVLYVSGSKVKTTVKTTNPDCIHPFFGVITPTTIGNEAPYKYTLNYGVDTLFEPDSTQNLVAGTYTIDIYNKNSCLVDSIKQELLSTGNCNTVYMPTAFMPESNLYGNQNRFLRPFGVGGIPPLLKSIHFMVFNRFGYKVYESQDIYMQGWDGRVNGKLQDSGTYIWEVEYTMQSGESSKNSGYTVLIR